MVTMDENLKVLNNFPFRGEGSSPSPASTSRSWAIHNTLIFYFSRNGCDAPSGFSRNPLIIDLMKKYFINNIHRAADASSMERDLCDYASRIYLNVITSEDGISTIVDHIKKEQDRIKAEKPRRRAVSVGFTVNTIIPGAWVNIGTSAMHLTLVRGEML